mgnify:CR=1 FL=1
MPATASARVDAPTARTSVSVQTQARIRERCQRQRHERGEEEAAPGARHAEHEPGREHCDVQDEEPSPDERAHEVGERQAVPAGATPARRLRRPRCDARRAPFPRGRSTRCRRRSAEREEDAQRPEGRAACAGGAPCRRRRRACGRPRSRTRTLSRRSAWLRRGGRRARRARSAAERQDLVVGRVAELLVGVVCGGARRRPRPRCCPRSRGRRLGLSTRANSRTAARGVGSDGTRAGTLRDRSSRPGRGAISASAVRLESS